MTKPSFKPALLLSKDGVPLKVRPERPQPHLVSRCTSGSEALTLACALFPDELTRSGHVGALAAKRAAEVIGTAVNRVSDAILAIGLPPDAAVALLVSMATLWAKQQRLDTSAALALMGLHTASGLTSDPVDTEVALDLCRRLRKRTQEPKGTDGYTRGTEE